MVGRLHPKVINGCPRWCRDAYYAAVFHHHFGEIPRLLRQDVRVLEAGGLVHVGVESLFGTFFGQRLGLFLWQSPGGRQRSWAVLSTLDGLNINLVPPKLLADCRDWLRDVIGFVELDLTKPLDRTVEAFSGLLQRAHDHRLNGRGDEAALHFVMALDFILGSEGRSAESLAERAAVITHRPLGRTGGPGASYQATL